MYRQVEWKVKKVDRHKLINKLANRQRQKIRQTDRTDKDRTRQINGLRGYPSLWSDFFFTDSVTLSISADKEPTHLFNSWSISPSEINHFICVYVFRLILLPLSISLLLIILWLHYYYYFCYLSFFLTNRYILVLQYPNESCNIFLSYFHLFPFISHWFISQFVFVSVAYHHF